ncbi:MAG: NADP-specific glutamate dehydrogenase [Spirochaetales bacterium]|nr:NADP-specific glutamate dehydrogenase [Spirochaetales bacterium]
MYSTIDALMQQVKEKNPNQPEFHQAVHEFFLSIEKVLDSFPNFQYHRVVERMVEPERIIMFRVPWVNDNEELQINRGFRVEMNSTLGPYKGGLRFHPSVNLSIMKFLAFEQVYKNCLTSLSLGGGKGGSDFDPKGKSDLEVMRFTQSFMSELYRHIGENTDVPAGDIGVGGREIGFMFGQYKRLKNQFSGVLTGKGAAWGGSYLRPEATGYGLVYFSANMLETRDETFEGKTCLVSGSGNVAQFTAEKLLDLGAKVVTMSDSSGCIFDGDGIDRDKLEFIKMLKNVNRGRIGEYKEKYPHAEYHHAQNIEDHNPVWNYEADCAFPCATQNEINAKDAQNLVNNGVKLVAEGANMPTCEEGVNLFHDKGVLFGPAKAANAGGVAVSGLEMAQNGSRVQWPKERVDKELHTIMSRIHSMCVTYADKYSEKDNYVDGANIASFIKVANAMLDQGYV